MSLFIFNPSPSSGGSSGGSTNTSSSTSSSVNSMVLDDTINLLKTNFRSAENRNVGKYTWQNFVIDAFNDTSGIDGANSNYTFDSTNKLVKFKSASLIPTMTSNTAPSGVASSSGAWSTANDAWYAFNGNTNDTGWVCNAIVGWLAYQFPSASVVSQYNMYPRSDGINNSPKSWTFEGSNDGTNWTVLDTQTNITTGWTANTVKTFSITNTNSYTHYRVNITANNGGSTSAIGELQMISPNSVSNVVTTTDTASVQPKSIVIDAEVTGTVTFDISLDGGTTWVTNVALDTFIDLSSHTGMNVKIRANLSSGSTVQSLGYAWFNDSIQSPSDQGTIDRLNSSEINLLKTNFRVSALQNASKYAMKNLIVDDYNDSTGIDTSKSSNYSYDSTNKQVKAVVSYQNVTTGGTPTSGGDNASYPASNAFDNNTSTKWCSSQVNPNVNGVSYIGYNLGIGKSQVVTSIMLNQDATGDAITSALIQYSNDGTTWTTAYTANGLVAGVNNINFSNTVSAQYWRVLANSNPANASSSWNVIELQFLINSNSPSIIVSTADSVSTAPSNVLLDASYTLGTGDTIQFEISRDGGTTFTTVQPDTLTSLTGQPTGTSIVSRVTMTNNAVLTSLGYSLS